MNSTLHQRQMGTDTEQGNARFGAYRLALVAENQSQFAGAVGRPQQRLVSRILLPRDIGHHFPVERIRAARGAFIPSRSNGCTRSPRQSCPHEPPVSRIALAGHLSHRLSSSASSAGSINASKWRQGRGNSLQRRGFLIQGSGLDD